MARTVFGPPPALAGRGIGVGAMMLGIAVVGSTLVAASGVGGSARVALTVVAAVVALAGLIVLVVGIVRLAGGGIRLVLDDDGFVNATGPGAGVRSARWADVRKVRTDGSVVSIDLAGGRQSIVRTGTLAIDAHDLAGELRLRLPH